MVLILPKLIFSWILLLLAAVLLQDSQFNPLISLRLIDCCHTFPHFMHLHHAVLLLPGVILSGVKSPFKSYAHSRNATWLVAKSDFCF